MTMTANTAPTECAAYRGLAVPRRTLAWIVAFAIVAATATLCLSALFLVKRLGLNPLDSHTEFFAYSWIYGIRWGAGEQVFQPHSQLLFPIFALINWALGLSRGSPRAILDGWAAVSFWWPVFLMTASLAILYGSVGRRAVLINAAFSSLVFAVAIPLYLDDSALFSTSYHSLAIPSALLGLLFWKQYEADPARRAPIGFFVLLGIYTAACALGKPTFVAFAAPFFVMEAFKALQNRSAASFGKLALAACVATVVYGAAIIAVYHQGLGGLSLHLSLSQLFMSSQFHWYDAAKGATPMHWYFGYVVGVMGWLPSALLVASLTLASLSGRRWITLAGVGAGFFAALFCLYFRSQIHAHPEFMAAAATATIGAFRCSWLATIGHRKKLSGFEFASPLAIGLATIAAVVLLYPLDLARHDYLVQQSKFESATIDALFQERGSAIRTLAVMNHPDVFVGTADAWCRGGGNIFDGSRSPAIDGLFKGIACANYAQARTTDLRAFDHVVFIQRAASRQDIAIADLVAAFPQANGRLRDCRKATAELPDRSFILQCELAAAD